jgi:hypothetical protein
MAQAKAEHSQQPQQSNQTKSASELPLDDLTYDLVTLLHAKSKALEAYHQYIEDAGAAHDQEVRALLETLRDQDVRAVEQLKPFLARCLSRSVGAAAQGSPDGAGDAVGETKTSGAV